MKNKVYKSFEYHFRDQRLYEDYCSLYSIGREYWRDAEAYHFDCNNVRDRQCIFQYTVSGEGAIVIGKKSYSLSPGQAFLIEKPGSYLYYLPKNSDHWEVEYIALNLSSINIWRDITEKYGRIIELDRNSSAMKYWDYLFELSLNDEMNNFFMSSAYAYTFMMSLNDTLKKKDEMMTANNAVLNCVNLIHENYHEDLSLQYLAGLCSVSTSYLSKKFKLSYKMSPIQYLIRRRIEVASSLLLRTDDKIEEIAHKVGFKDANYFARMFRQNVGVSPKEFREKEYTMVVKERKNEHLLFEQSPDC